VGVMAVYKKIRKITKNNALYGQFKYQIQYSDLKKYVEAYAWCIAQWGASAEYSIFNEVKDMFTEEQHWAYRVKFITPSSSNKAEIYLRDDKDLTIFALMIQ
jgi:hypothetical protein